MSDAEQAQLSMKLVEDIQVFLRARGKSDVAALGFLLAFVWGWARRCKYSTQELVNRADQAWGACERVDDIRKRGNLQ
jgi:hypothetical protein